MHSIMMLCTERADVKLFKAAVQQTELTCKSARREMFCMSAEPCWHGSISEYGLSMRSE